MQLSTLRQRPHYLLIGRPVTVEITHDNQWIGPAGKCLAEFCRLLLPDRLAGEIQVHGNDINQHGLTLTRLPGKLAECVALVHCRWRRLKSVMYYVGQCCPG